MRSARQRRSEPALVGGVEHVAARATAPPGSATVSRHRGGRARTASATDGAASLRCRDAGRRPAPPRLEPYGRVTASRTPSTERLGRAERAAEAASPTVKPQAARLAARRHVPARRSPPASSWSCSPRRGAAGSAPAVFAVTAAAAVRHRRAVYHRGTWSPAGRRRAQAARPRQHLPAHRRHLHAVRAAAAPRRRRRGRCCCDRLDAAPLGGVLFRVLLGRRAALALHADLHRARLGGGVLPRPTSASAGGAAVRHR